MTNKEIKFELAKVALTTCRHMTSESLTESITNLYDWVMEEPTLEPAWSKEDEKVANNLISELGNLCTRKLIKEETAYKYVNWIKSLKDRVQPKIEWGEEDKEYINDLIGVFDGQQHQAHSDEEIVKWLKSIRLPYNKEWDENDKEMLRSIIATCELAEQDRDSSPARHLLEMQLNWLKSLKERVQPQPKQEWSEEDERKYIQAVEALEDFGKFELADWLKEHKN